MSNNIRILSAENIALTAHEYNHTITITPFPPYNLGKKRQLREAAEALLPEYESNKELTIFTVLDTEAFHE